MSRLVFVALIAASILLAASSVHARAPFGDDFRNGTIALALYTKWQTAISNRNVSALAEILSPSFEGRALGWTASTPQSCSQRMNRPQFLDMITKFFQDTQLTDTNVLHKFSSYDTAVFVLEQVHFTTNGVATLVQRLVQKLVVARSPQGDGYLVASFEEVAPFDSSNQGGAVFKTVWNQLAVAMQQKNIGAVSDTYSSRIVARYLPDHSSSPAPVHNKTQLVSIVQNIFSTSSFIGLWGTTMSASCDVLFVRFLLPTVGIPPAKNDVTSVIGLYTFGDYATSGSLKITAIEEFAVHEIPGKF
jgi:hypothetical protein